MARIGTDGAKEVCARLNVAVTAEHKKKLLKLSKNDMSAWIRQAIDKAWEEKKGPQK